MKKIIYGSILLGLMALASLSSCKKEETTVNPVSNKTVEPSMIGGIHYIHGRVYYIDDLGNNTILSYYMRSLYDSPIWGFGCHLPSENCLPDALSNGGNTHDEVTNEMHNLTAGTANEFNISFGTQMVNAVQNGSASIKVFFNVILVPEMDYSEQLIIDFNNDLLTIKKFDEGYFIVNVNATSPNDFPNYN